MPHRRRGTIWKCAPLDLPVLASSWGRKAARVSHKMKLNASAVNDAFREFNWRTHWLRFDNGRLCEWL